MFVLPGVVRRWGVDLFLAVNQAFSPLLSCRTVSVVQNLLYYHYREFYWISPLEFRARLGLEARNLYFSLLNGWSARRAVHIVAVSETVRREISCREKVPLEKISVVPLAGGADIDPMKGAPQPDLNSVRRRFPGPFLLSVGALEPYKNIDRAIVGLARLRQGRGTEDVCLVVAVGLNAHGYDRYLRRVAAEMGVAEAVHFLDPVSHAELGAWYRAAKALVLLSACEAFPLPPLEAMAWGTPVIASNLSAVPEVVGEGGLLVDPYDAEQVAGAMRAVLTDSSLREALVSRGYAWVRRYSWERTAAEMTALWRACV
jgi:glycosyltransferase involved in cell wall biosynthesis